MEAGKTKLAMKLADRAARKRRRAADLATGLRGSGGEFDDDSTLYDCNKKTRGRR